MNGNSQIQYRLKKANGNFVLLKNGKQLVTYQARFWSEEQVEKDALAYFKGLTKNLGENKALFINEIEQERCQNFRRAMAINEARGFEQMPLMPFIELFRNGGLIHG